MMMMMSDIKNLTMKLTNVALLATEVLTIVCSNYTLTWTMQFPSDFLDCFSVNRSLSVGKK